MRCTREEFNRGLALMVRIRRKALGLDQASVAKACGLQQSELSRIESGKRRLDCYEVSLLARALGVDLTALYEAVQDLNVLQLADKLGVQDAWLETKRKPLTRRRLRMLMRAAEGGSR